MENQNNQRPDRHISLGKLIQDSGLTQAILAHQFEGGEWPELPDTLSKYPQSQIIETTILLNLDQIPFLQEIDFSM